MTTSGHDILHSFHNMHSLAKVSPATSLIAETITTAEQVTSQSEAELSALLQDLDDFSKKLTADDARVLVDLLKLVVAKRAGDNGKESLSCMLTALGTAYPQVGTCLLSGRGGKFHLYLPKYDIFYYILANINEICQNLPLKVGRSVT